MHKKIIPALLLIFFLFSQATALAADVKLAWDPNTEPELKGYYVYYGTASGDYTQKEDAGNQTTYTVTGLTEGTTYYFAVTAYSDTVESDYSDEISYKVPVPVVTYTLTASAGANGTIDPSGTITVNQNTSQTFNISPATNYHVADVKVDGASVGAVTSYTFSNITANHTIEVTFAIDTYTINATAGANGAISPSGSITVNAGDSKTFTITPAENYHIADVKVDGASIGAVGTYTFGNITADHSISVTFEENAPNVYTITASAGAGGSISPSGSISAEESTNKTFTITPASNYHVADVKVDGTSVGAVTSYTFSNVTANHTIEATFAVDTYTISATAGANGAISPSGSITVNAGDSKTFTITPAENYHVADIEVDGASVGAVSTYTFDNITDNHSIAAYFEEDAPEVYSITATAGAGGSISPSGNVSAEEGTSQAFTITPADNYHVADVKVDGTSVGAVTSYTFSNITANHTIEASFAVDTYTITTTTGANGAISPSGTVTVNAGDAKTFTITPADNYHVADVKVDGASVGAVTSYTFSNITANHTIEASFAVDTYTITTTAGANGAISPSGTVAVNAGASQTFTITPAADYHVADVKVDGTSVGAVNTYTFNNITANHSISATFEENAASTYTITASAGSGGTISPSGAVTVEAGKSQTFTITSSRFYSIDDVQVDGVSIGAVNSYTLSETNADHTITVSFKMGLTKCDEVTLAWNPSADPAVLGYKVYYGTASGSYDITVDTGSTPTCSISGLAYDQRYYFKITAYTANGENDYSGEFTYDTCGYKSLPPPILKLLGLQ